MEFALASSAIAHAVGTDSRWDKIVAFETGVTIVTNFRSRSQKSSYHTPRLDAFANRHLFQHATKFRVCLDIGDFASLSFIPPGTKKDNLKTIVRNCGPGNMFIDYAMRYITSNRLETDYDGTWGARGNIDFSVVDRFVNRHDYLDKQPSPEIIREMFGNHEAQDLVEECIDLGMTSENIIATVTRITARNLARQYRRILADHFHSDVEVDEAFICGAGAENCNFVKFFAAEFTPTAILTCFNDIGISGKAKQAVSYAYMGLNIALGESFQSFTVGKEEIFTGDIVYGRRWEEFGNQILKTEGDKLQQDRLHKPLNDCHPPIRSAIPIPELLIDPALLREYGQS